MDESILQPQKGPWWWTRPYRPASEDHRKKLSDAQRKRLNIPQNCRMVYGVILPEGLAEAIYPLIAEIARKWGYQRAQAFLTKFIARPRPFVETIRIMKSVRRRLAYRKPRVISGQKSYHRKMTDDQKAANKLLRIQVRREILEPKLNDAMFLFDEGMEVNGIAETLKISRSSIKERLRTTRRVS